MVVASRLIRPGTIYRALAVLLRPEGGSPAEPRLQPIQVRASVSRDGVELASALKTMTPGDVQMLMMKVRVKQCWCSCDVLIQMTTAESVGRSV